MHTKQAIKDKLGKVPLLHRGRAELSAKAEYLGGIPELDHHVGSQSVITNITARPKGLEIAIGNLIKMDRYPIPFDKINYCALEHQQEIIDKKKKSVIGRALLGTFIAGPVGTLVGGMSGIGHKEKRLNDVDNILVISYGDEDNAQLATFSVKNKHYQETMKWMRSYLSSFVNA